MSQADAQRRVISSLTDSNALSPEGSAKVQMKSGTAYVSLPSRLVAFYGIEQGDSLVRAYHPESDCLIIPLNGSVDLFE